MFILPESLRESQEQEVRGPLLLGHGAGPIGTKTCAQWISRHPQLLAEPHAGGVLMKNPIFWVVGAAVLPDTFSQRWKSHTVTVQGSFSVISISRSLILSLFS